GPEHHPAAAGRGAGQGGAGTVARGPAHFPGGAARPGALRPGDTPPGSARPAAAGPGAVSSTADRAAGHRPAAATVDNSAFDELFADRPIMALFRGLGVERSVELARRAWRLGIELVELPIQSDADVEALAAVAAEARALGRRVGAGTIIAPHQVELAAGAGADFVVSPGLDAEVVRAAAAAGLPPLPGVATASEIQAAQRLGLRWLKAFPATALGPGWFRAMRGPFPDARFVATGGVDASNASTFLEAGVRVVAVGSALEDEAQLPRLAALLAR
ncbi:bifunctional 4-hydroxy-2-oxoglutarate aldolase/2-dehydro-3-deoxy-phosphogluconate aldolase, partial [Agromyces soli]